MRYASMRSMDITNGEGIGVALFVQGCHFHCKNCFNSETWDFSGGKEFTHEKMNELIKMADKQQITRLSILGGEPLCIENIDTVHEIIKTFKMIYPDKKIWLYTGSTLEELRNVYGNNFLLLNVIDILIDGKYIDELKDMNLKWRGSSNQRVIDVQKTLKEEKIVLYCD